MGGGVREEEEEHEELFKRHLEVKMSDVPPTPAFTALTEENNRKVKGQVKRKMRGRRRALWCLSRKLL